VLLYYYAKGAMKISKRASLTAGIGRAEDWEELIKDVVKIKNLNIHAVKLSRSYYKTGSSVYFGRALTSIEF